MIGDGGEDVNMEYVLCARACVEYFDFIFHVWSPWHSCQCLGTELCRCFPMTSVSMPGELELIKYATGGGQNSSRIFSVYRNVCHFLQWELSRVPKLSAHTSCEVCV